MSYKKEIVEKIFNFIKDKSSNILSKMSKEESEKFDWNDKKDGCLWICSEIYLSLEFFRKLNPSIYLKDVSYWEDKCETIEELRQDILKDLTLDQLKFIKYILIDFDENKGILYDLLDKDVCFIRKTLKDHRIKRNMKKDKCCEQCGSFGDDDDGKLMKYLSLFYCSEECYKKHKCDK